MAEPASYEFITLLKRLSVRLHQNIDAILKPYDLARSQYVMMYYLAAQPGLSSTELAEKMMVEPATLSGIADTLQSKGLVGRREQIADKRRKIIYLTESGESLFKKIPPPGPEVERLLLDGISYDEAMLFKDVGYKMIANLEKEGQTDHATED